MKNIFLDKIIIKIEMIISRPLSKKGSSNNSSKELFSIYKCFAACSGTASNNGSRV